MKYLHDEQLVHGDVKPENVIFDNNNIEPKLVKITDVALFTLLDTDLLRHTLAISGQYCGNSLSFMESECEYPSNGFIDVFLHCNCLAPEVLRNELGNPVSDMWSFGVVAYLL